MKIQTAILTALLLGGTVLAKAQEAKHEDTEFYTPVPKVVTPALKVNGAPSDATILFDGKNLDQWVMTDDRTQPAKWKVAKNILTVEKGTGNIETKKSFSNYQLHLEFRIPSNITGEGQARGNSGLFLASLGKGDLGYELQILDNYNNKTYTNGMVGSIYKQTTPLSNPATGPGKWQTYDVVWTAPTFNADSSVKTPAIATVIYNGVVVQNAFVLKGPTQYVGQPAYRKAHGPAPIKLQAHGDESAPISFRNIWIRDL